VSVLDDILSRIDTHDSNIKAKETFETVIPDVPVTGSYGEKLKQAIIAYEIVRGNARVSLGAGLEDVIIVQPPAGETWRVSPILFLGTELGRCFADIFDGTTQYGVAYDEHETTYRNVCVPPTVIDNTYYCRLIFTNTDTVAHDYAYTYTGFKIKSSSITYAKFKPTKRLVEDLKETMQRNNPHSRVTLPDYVKALEKYAFADWEGDIAVYVEKDVALRLDEKGNVIERRSRYFKLKEFERLFGDLIADTTKRPLMDYIRARSVERKMGWEKYIGKWKAEGIEF